MKTKSTNARTAKQPPQRTCVACRRVGAKRGLVRLVRTVDDSVDIDVTGKQAGRGAYLCRNKECWEIGINSGKLEHSLRMSLSPENRQLIMKHGQDLIEENIVG